MTVVSRSDNVASFPLALAYAIGALLLVPDRGTWTFVLPGAGATNLLVLPVAFWALSIVYAGLAWRLTGGRPHDATAPALRAALAIYIVLLLRSVVPILDDAAAFSSRAYRLYTEAIVWGAIVVSTAWSLRSLPFLRSRHDSPLFAVPLALAAFALASAYAGHDALLAAAAVGVGLVLSRLSTPALFTRALAGDVSWLAGLFLVALVLRLAFTMQVMTNPRYVETGPDGATYDTLAWSMAQGQGVPEAFADLKKLMLLGYVRFVAAIYEIAGRSYFVVCVIQSLLGAAACVFVYLIAKRTFGVVTARIAAGFSAVSFLLIFSAAALAHQAVDVFLMALVVWMLLRYVREPAPGWLWAAAIGVVLGAAIANRETVACFWAFLLLWLPWALSRRIGWLAAVARTAAMTVAMFALLAPLLFQIVATPEDRALARTHLDYLFMASAREGMVAPFADPAAAAQQFSAQPAAVTSTFLNSVWTNFAIQFLQHDAGAFDLVFLRRGSMFFYGMLATAYALACAGLAVALRRVWRGAPETVAIALILGLIVSRTAIHLALASTYLHRAPIEPFLIMLASVAVARLLDIDERPA